MKISEAMREGSKKVPKQCFWESSIKDFITGKVEAACASETVRIGDLVAYDTMINFHRDSVRGFDCDICKINHLFLQTYIVHLNDIHRFSREKIAGMLEEMGI